MTAAARAAAISRVLLVDDEPDIRQIAELSLRAVARWEVVAAGSGRQAVEVAEASRPDVILLDVMMPSMDGPTTLGELRRSPALRGVPVIFMTAKAQKHEIERYLALGASGVIIKPFDPMSLAAEIRRIVERSGSR